MMSLYADTSTQCPLNIRPPEYKPTQTVLKNVYKPSVIVGILRYKKYFPLTLIEDFLLKTINYGMPRVVTCTLTHLHLVNVIQSMFTAKK